MVWTTTAYPPVVGLITTKGDKLQPIGTNYNRTPKTGQITTSNSLPFATAQHRNQSQTQTYALTSERNHYPGWPVVICPHCCRQAPRAYPSSWVQQHITRNWYANNAQMCSARFATLVCDTVQTIIHMCMYKYLLEWTRAYPCSVLFGPEEQNSVDSNHDFEMWFRMCSPGEICGT